MNYQTKMKLHILLSGEKPFATSYKNHKKGEVYRYNWSCAIRLNYKQFLSYLQTATKRKMTLFFIVTPQVGEK